MTETRRRSPFSLAVTAVRATTLGVLLAVAIPADELRLGDGRVLVGKVVERGQVYEVTTSDGVVVVAKDKVTARRTDAELRAALARQAETAGDTPFAALQLAIRARDFGLEPELWRHLDRALASLDDANDPTDGALGRRLRDFLAQLEAQLLPRAQRTAPTATRVHRLLERARPDAPRAQRAAVVELLVREANADEALRQEARGHGRAATRLTALAALQRRELAGNDRFVLRTAIVDRDAEVRRAAIDIAHPGAEAVAYLAPGLSHPNAQVRVRTAEAYAAIARPEAIKLLVAAGPNAGKGIAAADNQGVRGHIAILEQQAFIRDFDVEVASSSFIADPKVDTLLSGAVLDVTAIGVDTERITIYAYRRALQSLAGQDPGADPRGWAGWLANLGDPRPAHTAPR